MIDLEKKILEKINRAGMIFNSNNFRFNNFQEIKTNNIGIKKNALWQWITSETISLTKKEANYLIKNTDFKFAENNKLDLLNYFFIVNNLIKKKLDERQISLLLKNNNLKSKDNNNLNSLMYAIRYTKKNDKNYLNNKQWFYLLKNSDLKIATDDWQETPLLYAIYFSDHHNFDAIFWDYLIKNSNLDPEKPEKDDPIVLLAGCKKLKLNKKLIILIVDKIKNKNEEVKIKTIIKAIENNHFYLAREIIKTNFIDTQILGSVIAEQTDDHKTKSIIEKWLIEKNLSKTNYKKNKI